MDTISESSPEFQAMVAVQSRVLTAAELAARVGIADDEVFRKAVTHHTQGQRALSPSSANFMRPDDPKVRYERLDQRERALATLEEALRKRVRAANRALYGDPPRSVRRRNFSSPGPPRS